MSPPATYAAAAPAGAAHPRWDKDFVDACLWDLITHAGQWRRLGRLYAPHAESFDRCTATRDAVEAGRRLGLKIESERGKGYRLVAIRHPTKWYTVKPGPAPRDEPAECDGQLVMVEV